MDEQADLRVGRLKRRESPYGKKKCPFIYREAAFYRKNNTLSGLKDLTLPQACRANPHSDCLAIDLCAHAL